MNRGVKSSLRDRLLFAMRATNPAFPEAMQRADSGHVLGVVVFQGREY